MLLLALRFFLDLIPDVNSLSDEALDNGLQVSTRGRKVQGE